MTKPLKYHAGEIAVQQRANAFDPADLDGNGLGSTFDPRVDAFLRSQRWAIISGLDSEGKVWVSCIWGSPGFMNVETERSLAIRASLPATDPLVRSFREGEEIGILALDPARRRRMRINGRARWEGEILRVSPSEVYGNCPKYIQRRELLAGDQPLAPQVASGSVLSADQREWIQKADTFFIGSINVEAGLDCSHRGGNPGFVQATGPNQIAFPDYAGNNMFQTLGNFELDPRAGLLFIDFESGATLQMTGKAVVSWDEARLARWPGAQSLIEFHVERVQETTRALPLRWRLLDYSPFNPEAGGGYQ